MTTLTRILYAEDEPDIQQIAIIALETLGGFTLEVCDTGEQALACIDSFKPQLLLFDVMMPKMDGPTALRKIQAMDGYHDIPAIFMTAKIQPDEVEKYREMGAIDVISKPFDPMTLADTIRQLWQQVQ